MIKGCQKRMIFIKDTGSDLFDEAYFILKNDIPSQDDEGDIIRKATAIINQHDFPLKRKKRERKCSKGFFSFIAGALLGAMLCALLFIIF